MMIEAIVLNWGIGLSWVYVFEKGLAEVAEQQLKIFITS